MPSRTRTSPRPKSSSPSSAGAQVPDATSASLEELDALFASAGLKRHRREKPAGVVHRARYQEKSAEELQRAPAEPYRAPNGVEFILVPRWKTLSWLWHGFSTRRGGVSRAYAPEDAPGELNLGFTPDDDRAHVLRNRELLAEAVTGDSSTPIVTLRQIHSSVLILAESVSGDRPCRGDSLVTGQPGLLLGVQTADCIPVLVADRKRKAVAAFHAGWRGTVKRIVEAGIGRMRLEFGSRPEDLTAAIGPGVGPCCYAVGEEVQSQFESQFTYAPALFHEVYDTDPVRTKYPMLFLTQRAPGHSLMGPSLHLDLIEANRRQLLAAGLKPGAIHVATGCTNCHPNTLFSHRASGGRTGRMMSVIGIRP